MKAEVVNRDLKKVGEVDLKDTVFGAKEMPYLWHEMVKWQLAKKRQGTAKTKQRHEVSGTTKKMYKQKHTGRARHGSAKAPIFVGGGQVFGPIPRSYEYTIPKKMKKAAVRSALSMKHNKKLLKVVADLNIDELKTKKALAMLKPFEFETALIIDQKNDMLNRAVRNLRNFKFIQPEGINVYDLMKFNGVIVTQSALEKIQEAL